ncbi:LUD domain-containing protein [Tumebacillus sp. ITR2]|uniref:LUD domain-containing protein n=1 Tax=Tumebacillus amylolyticus TaxID=2801339 RepID=A0ABS1JBB8_9BACL|nr:LUD domain-containing protein [Tumebacillus amylolyticus]MBL0387576.1 LUD domain-containing protein [Tumebacillus amylolyticus]
MTNKHEMLAKLNEQSQQRQHAFLDGIANRLGRPRLTEKPAHPHRGAPDFWQRYEISEEERVALFVHNWNGLGGIVRRFSEKEALSAFVAEVADTLGAKNLVRWDHELLQDLNVEARLPHVEMTVWNSDDALNLKAKAAGADIGIVVADHAIAQTGTVCVTSDAGKGRSVSLLPTALITIIQVEDLKTRMGEVLTALQTQYGTTLPAGVHFITGPSRSADIENDLTIGVHGPGIVYALLLG